MRYFYFDNEKNAPVLVALPFEYHDNPRFSQIFESDREFYVEVWRDESFVRELHFATIHKPNSEIAKMARERAAKENHFKMSFLVSLDVPTKEFEAIIEDFGIIPIIID